MDGQIKVEQNRDEISSDFRKVWFEERFRSFGLNFLKCGSISKMGQVVNKQLLREKVVGLKKLSLGCIINILVIKIYDYIYIKVGVIWEKC